MLLTLKAVRTAAVMAAFATLVEGAPAHAEPAVGTVAGTNTLVAFDTAAPGSVSATKPITGLAPGDLVAALDFRRVPSTAVQPTGPAQLFALGVQVLGANASIRLYALDFGSGVATTVGTAPIIVPAGSAWGMDLNPVADRLRVVNDADVNLRLNPNTGDLVVTDAPITPAGGKIAAIAYDRVAPSSPPVTTLYAIRTATSGFGTIGGIDSAPSANGGVFMPIGPLGVTPDAGSQGSVNLDIASDGTAIATMTVGGVSGLYAIDRTSGTATLAGVQSMQLSSLALVPPAVIDFGADAVSAGESGAATIEVVRHGPEPGSLAATTSVDYATSNDAASGTLTFAPGESTKSFTVPIVNDSLDEPDETVTLTLASPGFPAALGRRSSTLTIVDDDPPPALPVVERITSVVRPVWLVFRRYAVLKRLRIAEIPAGAKVKLRCRGKGCPFRRRSFTPTRGRVNASKAVNKAHLRRGSTLQVRIVKPGAIGKVVIYHVPKKGVPIGKVRCLPPGETRPRRTC
jgi:hypothetical protein